MVLVCEGSWEILIYYSNMHNSDIEVAPYISQQKKNLAEAPALDEFEYRLPTTSIGSGSTVRIPPELMPPEEQCTEWFETFFTQIHPYVPVISKPYFYTQWRTNRSSISPLILEAIFACAGRMSDDPAQGLQWLALASSTSEDEGALGSYAYLQQNMKTALWTFRGLALSKLCCCCSRLAKLHPNGAITIDLG